MTVKTYYVSKNGNKKLATNFKVKEFQCHDGTINFGTTIENLPKILHYQIVPYFTTFLRKIVKKPQKSGILLTTLLITSVLLVVPTVASAQYYVKSGDTMWKIAQKNGISLPSLISLNPHISNPNQLRIGDYIVIKTRDTATDLTDYAKSLQGVTKYVYGGQNAPYETDCSGWTQHIYGKFGIKLPRVSKDQARVGTPITFKNMKRGDLMFFSTRADKVISHVGIYLGDNYWISNLNAKQNVTILSTWGTWTQQYFLWAQRVI